MHVFVTGASGHLGSAVVPELLAGGHRVTGLARSDAAAAGLEEAARETDGIVHLAFRHDLMGQGDYVGALDEDLRAIEAMANGLVGRTSPLSSPLAPSPLPPRGPRP